MRIGKELWWNRPFSAKYKNIAREFCRGIGDIAPKILRIKAFLLRNKRIIFLK